MKLVYVCSPLRGDIDTNLINAMYYSKYVAICGYIPITPHLYFTRFLNDIVDEERELGIKMGMELLKHCDEIWVFGDYISKGMRNEINVACEIGITLKFIDSDLIFRALKSP